MSDLDMLHLRWQVAGEMVRRLECELSAALRPRDAEHWPERTREQQVKAMHKARAEWKTAADALWAAEQEKQ